MNLFNLFGKNKQVKTQSPQIVIQNMKDTLDTLEKREVHLEKCINNLKEEARTLVKTNKLKALSLLKKAKMTEKHILSIYGQKENIERQIFALEQGINNQNIIECIKQGKNTIDNMVNKLNPEDIGELIDDISASIDMSDEISNILSQPIGVVEDEGELLDMLENEESDNIKDDVFLQVLPNKKIIANKVLVSEDEELVKLQELMMV